MREVLVKWQLTFDGRLSSLSDRHHFWLLLARYYTYDCYVICKKETALEICFGLVYS